MAKQSFARGARYKGKKAIFGPPDADKVAHYAVDGEGNLLKRGGVPVRLVQVDLAPGDPDNGAEEFLIAGPDDPEQVSGSIVDLEVEEVNVKTEAGA